MLKEIEPQLTRAAFVANPKTTPYDYFLRAAEAAAPSLAIELVPVRVQTATDIERSIEVFGRVPNGRLVGRFHGSNRMPTKIGSPRCCCDTRVNEEL